MNIAVSNTILAAAESAFRPQVRIVIVGHVDHGKSTLVGRLLHETGSLPDGKLEMLQAVSARRGMPFEWSFLLDALQTERDQGDDQAPDQSVDGESKYDFAHMILAHDVFIGRRRLDFMEPASTVKSAPPDISLTSDECP